MIINAGVVYLIVSVMILISIILLLMSETYNNYKKTFNKNSKYIKPRVKHPPVYIIINNCDSKPNNNTNIKNWNSQFELSI